MPEYTIWSEELNQYVELKRPASGGFTATCEDGVTYSTIELSRFTSAEVPLSIEAHLLKKVFEGEVSKVEPVTPVKKITVGQKMPLHWLKKW